MKNILEDNFILKENNTKLPNINNQENNTNLSPYKISQTENQDFKNKENKSSLLDKFKNSEQHGIKPKESISKLTKLIKSDEEEEEENQFEKEKNNYINDFNSEESERNSPKIIDGKLAIDINEILGEELKQPLLLEMIDDTSILLTPGKISAKSFGVITSYAANTNQGIVRDYNEDRVSVIINMNKPKYYTSSSPWPRISYFGVFDGHAGNRCAEFMRDNLLNYICNNNYFPHDIPNAIKYGFKKIDEDYLYNYAFIDHTLIDNSGSCGLILLIIDHLIYIANVGDSRCLGSFKNGKIQKDITLDHKPNTPYEKERILKNGGKIYQTQTPIEDDENFKDKILVGPYRVFPGKLSVSRTVGDAEGKITELGGNPNVIVPAPDIFCFDLQKDDIDFFILGCDGIYDQLYSKDIFKCAWMVINNNLELCKNNNFNENCFVGNYGEIINMNTTSGNIVDFILKASMIRKSFDNVTCLFIAFKNFFENYEKNLQVQKINKDININIKITNNNYNNININKDMVLKKKSNIQDENGNLKEAHIIFKEKNKSEKNLFKDNNRDLDNKEKKELKNDKAEEESKDKNNNSNIKKIKGGQYNTNKKKIRINSLPKQPILNIAKLQHSEENTSNLSNNLINSKNMTVNNIITYNNNFYLNSDNNSIKTENEPRVRHNSLNEKIINSINNNANINFIQNQNNQIIKENKINNNNHNILTNASNHIFFTKMHIVGINNKHKNKKDIKYNKLVTNNLINKDDNYRHSSYSKKIQPLFIENLNDINTKIDNNKKEKYMLAQPNNNNNNNNNNKKINYIKLNEAHYVRNIGNNENILGNNNNGKNIRSNSNCNAKIDYNKINIKPILFKNDKFQIGNNNHNIKFNNIIKTNNYGLINNKLNNITDVNLMSLKNNTLTKIKKTNKADEIKIRNPMPTLGQLHIDKTNKLIEENNFVKQRRFITNDNVKRKSNLSEHKKLGNGSYKIELNISNKNNTGIGNKINNLFSKKVENNGLRYNLIKNNERKVLK